MKKTLIEQLGIKNFQATSNSYTFTVFLDEFYQQPTGHLNGGATLALAEVTAGMASQTLCQPGKFPVGQHINATHLQPIKIGQNLIGRGRLRHHGKRTHLWQIDFFDEAEQLISLVEVTNFIIVK